MNVMKQSPLFMTSEATERPIPDNQEPPSPVMSEDKISPLKIRPLVSPVFIFGVLIILSSVIFPDKAYEPVWLLPILNLIFLIIIPYLIAVFVSIMFLKTGVLTFLLLGSGMISYGLGSFLSGIAIDYNPNITVILHNTGSLLGGLFHFICAILSFFFREQRLTVRNRWIKLIAVYSIIAAGLIFLFWGASADTVPIFFTPRVGSTLIRQWVLGGAILFYEITVILFILLYTRSRQLFILIYSIALSLMGIGLLGVWFQEAVGSPMGWLGRSSQYVGAVYFLASVVSVYRKGESDLHIEKILSGFFGNYLKERVEIHTAELKEAQESLRRDHSLFNSIANTSPVGIVVLDREGKITFANPRAESILGLPKKQITQLNYDAPARHITHFDGRSFPDGNLPFRRVMAAGRTVFEVEHAIEWSDGRQVLLSINAAPILGPNGQGYGMVAAIEDITERKQAEEKINQLLKEKEILFQEVRHRIKNNLNNMVRLLPLQPSTLEDPKAAVALEDAKGRLRSMEVLYNKIVPHRELTRDVDQGLPPAPGRGDHQNS